MRKKILIAAGGTGGHLFPAMAVVRQLEKINNGNVEFIFVGSASRMEAQIVPAAGYDFFPINITGLNLSLSIKTLLLPLRIVSSISICRKLIREKNIDAVICAGAYLSYPPGVAASKEGKPLFLMESNVNPGKTNKALSRRANLIFTAFPESESYFPVALRSKLRPFGNPVREDMLKSLKADESRQRFGLDPDKRTILAFGGSLGARSINRAMESFLKDFGNTDYQMLWQTGKNHIPPINIPKNVKCLQFIVDMAAAYASADLVVSRSGATTIAELCVVGKPSILIPLSSASNNEQYNNAKVLESAGASVIITDVEAQPKLQGEILSLLSDNNRMNIMAEKAKTLATPDAAEKCASEIMNYLDKQKK